MAPLIVRWLDRGRSKKIVLEELDDLARHCNATIEVLNNIDPNLGLPARMHFDKARMFETGLIFDNDIARSVPASLRRRFVNIRLVVRNLDRELVDFVDFFYGKSIRSQEEFTGRLTYQIEKFEYAATRLAWEIASIRGDSVERYPDRPKHIVYHDGPYQ